MTEKKDKNGKNADAPVEASVEATEQVPAPEEPAPAAAPAADPLAEALAKAAKKERSDWKSTPTLILAGLILLAAGFAGGWFAHQSDDGPGGRPNFGNGQSGDGGGQFQFPGGGDGQFQPPSGGQFPGGGQGNRSGNGGQGQGGSTQN